MQISDAVAGALILQAGGLLLWLLASGTRRKQEALEKAKLAVEQEKAAAANKAAEIAEKAGMLAEENSTDARLKDCYAHCKELDAKIKELETEISRRNLRLTRLGMDADTALTMMETTGFMKMAFEWIRANQKEITQETQ